MAFITLAVLTLGLTAPTFAQHYHVHTYTEGDGLPNSAVRGLAQDSSGRLWFATRAGVAVYDGQDWISYSRESGLEPPERRRSAISCARMIFSGVCGHHDPDATVLSLAITTVWRPHTFTNAVTTPAPGA